MNFTKNFVTTFELLKPKNFFTPLYREILLIFSPPTIYMAAPCMTCGGDNLSYNEDQQNIASGAIGSLTVLLHEFEIK